MRLLRVRGRLDDTSNRTTVHHRSTILSSLSTELSRTLSGKLSPRRFSEAGGLRRTIILTEGLVQLATQGNI